MARKRYTDDEIKTAVEENGYTLESIFMKNETIIEITHNLCGKTYTTRPKRFIDEGNRCTCETRKSQKDFEKEVFDLVGDEFSVLGQYKLNNKPILFKHNICGRTFKRNPVYFLANPNCMHCTKQKQYDTKRKDTEWFKEQVKLLENDKYIVIGEYLGTKDYIRMKHVKCGYEYNVKPNNFLTGKRCPRCGHIPKTTSKLEKEVLTFVQKNYNGSIQSNKRFYIKDTSFHEIDIYLPDLKIGIEFDGLYWHSDQFKIKTYHLDKTNFFKNKGIRIIHIFEDEWLNKQDIVKSKLKHILNISDNEKVYARKTLIKEITNIEKTPFLDKYHIQGSDKAIIKLGEYYNDELVAVMTFSKLRRALGTKTSTVGDYELSRFATSKNVVGGFSKMLKYAIRNYEINYIKTFADLRWSSLEKNVYDTNNFVLSHISKPNYFYSANNKRYHRFNFRKNILKKKFPDIYKKELTEFEIMDQTNYSRIWDCGNLVYEMKIER